MRRDGAFAIFRTRRVTDSFRTAQQDTTAIPNAKAQQSSLTWVGGDNYPSKGLRLQSTCSKGLICKVSFTKDLARLRVRRRMQRARDLRPGLCRALRSSSN